MANPSVSRWASGRLPASPRFHKPPCDPGRSGFPIPVLTLVQPQRSPSWNERGLSADPHTPQPHPSLLPGACPCSPALGVARPVTTGTTKCPEPLRALEALPSHAVASPTTSAGVTPPSLLLLAHAPVLHPPTAYGHSLGQQVFAGCCQPRLGVAPSQRYLRESFPRCLDPYPGGPCGACTRFFPQGIGLPQFLTGSALHKVPHNDVSAAFHFEAAVIHSCSGLWVCSPPRSFPPQRSLRVRPCAVAVGFGG